MPQVIIVYGKNKKEINTQAKQGENLLFFMRRIGVFVENSCGGNKTCGKCAVLFMDGIPEVEAEDIILSKEGREKGWRLACCHKIEKDCKIWVEESCLEREKNERNGNKEPLDSDTIVIDIGTTTLAASLVRKSDGKLIKTVTAANSQRVYGSDVISRIKAANEGNEKGLRELIWKDIERLCESLNVKTISHIVISGNTVMEHLLIGDSCEGLGQAPFHPVNLACVEKDLKDVISDSNETFRKLAKEMQTKVTILPGISAFVGADIVSGLYAISMQKREKITLLIDLGTNGEMVLGTKSHMIATAVSAGPALEGAGISSGMPGISGAIARVNFLGKRVQTVTLGGKAPVGVCGTGVLETVCELYRAGILTKEGILEETYREKGFPLAKRQDGSMIYFTAQDVRMVQLAKSAIRSGIELLLKHYGITADEVDQVYLAGSFGQKLNVHKAVTIGLIPKKLEKKTTAMGNTSLLGAAAYVQAKDAGKQPRKDMEGIIRNTTVLNLAELPEFEEYYIKNMNFGEAL